MFNNIHIGYITVKTSQVTVNIISFSLFWVWRKYDFF